MKNKIFAKITRWAKSPRKTTLVKIWAVFGNDRKIQVQVGHQPHDGKIMSINLDADTAMALSSSLKEYVLTSYKQTIAQLNYILGIFKLGGRPSLNDWHRLIAYTNGISDVLADKIDNLRVCTNVEGVNIADVGKELKEIRDDLLAKQKNKYKI